MEVIAPMMDSIQPAMTETRPESARPMAPRRSKENHSQQGGGGGGQIMNWVDGDCCTGEGERLEANQRS